VAMTAQYYSNTCTAFIFVSLLFYCGFIFLICPAAHKKIVCGILSRNMFRLPSVHHGGDTVKLIEEIRDVIWRLNHDGTTVD
jgi:hypothetical protein